MTYGPVRPDRGKQRLDGRERQIPWAAVVCQQYDAPEMSYDFLLLPREPGQSWRELQDANEQHVLDEGDRRLSPAARTRLERIAGRLQAHDPQLERFTTGR